MVKTLPMLRRLCSTPQLSLAWFSLPGMGYTRSSKPLGTTALHFLLMCRATTDAGFFLDRFNWRLGLKPAEVREAASSCVRGTSLSASFASAPVSRSLTLMRMSFAGDVAVGLDAAARAGDRGCGCVWRTRAGAVGGRREVPPGGLPPRRAASLLMSDITVLKSDASASRISLQTSTLKAARRAGSAMGWTTLALGGSISWKRARTFQKQRRKQLKTAACSISTCEALLCQCSTVPAAALLSSEAAEYRARPSCAQRSMYSCCNWKTVFWARSLRFLESISS
mmetsp:Transcript_19660/g.75429  ORF Transcript_19660/g.75429 Transcript_19660/m.75429 type:complete len:282 (+) Transcript_19660:569-1414(+)